MRVTIVGAGIVGIAAAHAALDRGHDVTIVDKEGREGRATDANAGWIAHLDIMPLASPKVWRQLPRWLADPLGPLSIRPAYLPQLVPWLLRFLAASGADRIAAGSHAIRSLNALALPAWKTLLAQRGLDHHLREQGILSVWRNRADFARASGVLASQRALGIDVQELGPGDLAAIEPALRNVEAAALYPAGCHVSDPAILAADLLRQAVGRGARFISGQVNGIVPAPDGVDMRLADAEPLGADRVVVAAGAWSRPLAAQLGDAVPLDTERGYNATYQPGTFGLGRPVMFEGEGFVTTPLAIGDRVGGAVEFAGLNAPADHRRTLAVAQRLRRFLPGFNPDAPARRWMGFRPSIPDSLPVIGTASRDGRVIYAFGHGHLGLTQAAATAQLVANFLDGNPQPIDIAPFSAGRF